MRAAAHSLRAGAGRIRPGDAADFVALRIDSPDEFGWQFGGNLAKSVFKKGVAVSPFPSAHAEPVG
jgi:imidazolonepropionase-like amidohydrolase